MQEVQNRSGVHSPNRKSWHRAALVGICVALLPAAAMAQVSISTVYDFSTNNAALYGGTRYAGPALNPAQDQLWTVDGTYFAAFSLTGQVIFSGAMPSGGSVVFGALTFDAQGNAWGVAHDGTIFEISSSGVYSSVATVTNDIGLPLTGLAYSQGLLYGGAFSTPGGPQHLYNYDIVNNQLTALTSATNAFNLISSGTPLVTSSGNVYLTTNEFVFSSSHVLIGAYPLLNYNTTTGNVKFLAFHRYLGHSSYGGQATPAADSSGTVYFISSNVSPTNGSDTLIAVDAGGKRTRIWSFRNTSSSYNIFSGLIYDNIHGRLYGALSSGDGRDIGKVFCYNPTANNFAIIFRFNGKNGSGPVGNLALSADGTKLYGATSYGGAAYNATSGWDTGFGLLYELSLGTTPPC